MPHSAGPQTTRLSARGAARMEVAADLGLRPTFEGRMEGAVVPREHGPGRAIIAAWRTNNRATTYLVELLPAAVWSTEVPGISRLTVGMIAAHIQNSRCIWIRSIGPRHGAKVPRLVDSRPVRPTEVVRALSRSTEGMIALSEVGL